MNYIRYRHQGKTSYGIKDGSKVKEIRGGLFGERLETGISIPFVDIELLYPCEPTKLLAVGLNYKSHITLHSPGTPEPKNPEIFFKPPSALLDPGKEIQIPPDAQNTHYEGELVIVIGKAARQVSIAEAEGCIFGFTCGIDVSERIWQKNDLQWWRAKGCDTFAPAGPAIVTNFDWRQGRIETRVNGATVQSGQFSELLFNPPAIVSYASRYVTLMPGDLIYTGTPGNTDAIQEGDIVEVEIPGIGILRNPVAKLK
jgi:2-keto-4-pentenoate hydratase/2-oxohepta-3-ene-1,7-dioic acid hydratase in catechol pathway